MRPALCRFNMGSCSGRRADLQEECILVRACLRVELEGHLLYGCDQTSRFTGEHSCCLLHRLIADRELFWGTSTLGTSTELLGISSVMMVPLNVPDFSGDHGMHLALSHWVHLGSIQALWSILRHQSVPSSATRTALNISNDLSNSNSLGTDPTS